MEQRLFDKYRHKNPPEVFEFGSSGTPCVNVAAIIPVYHESVEDLSETLDNLQCNLPNALILLVLNYPSDAPKKAVQANNLALDYLYARQERMPQLGILNVQAILGGVGEARKRGMDSAIPLITNANAASQAILLSLDADTHIGPGYYQMAQITLKDFKGASFNIHHRTASSAEQENAIRKYEQYLEHFQQGLAHAGSPFAFKALGSAIGCTVDGYIESGGMRVRAAGEDFYFLQAMAKCFEVKFCGEVQVFPSPRCSERVPFGTGRAVANLLNGGEQTFFPATAFDELKQVISCATLEALESPEMFLELLSLESRAFFESFNFATKWTMIAKEIPYKCRRNEFFKLFDGLKELQFLKHISSINSAKNFSYHA